MRVLIADKFEASGLEGLIACGCEVLYQPDLKGPSLTEALKQGRAEVLVVRSTPVTAADLEAGALSLVVRAGAGVNTIDVNAAAQRGIYVANCPGRNAVAVAELAFGLMLALDRRIPDNVETLRQGYWDKKRFSSARGIFGRTLGLLGLGNIGREMVRRAQAFGMPVVFWSLGFEGQDRPMSEAELGAHDLLPLTRGLEVRMLPTPEEVAARSDVLSLHLPCTSETRGIVSASVLERMKPGASLINTARGELIDYAALKVAILERGLQVGLDVFENEPAAGSGPFVDELVSMPGVYGTHHIGASTEQAQEAIAEETVNIVRTYKRTGKVPNVVNLCTRTPASFKLVVRHRDRPGVLAHIFEQLRERNINVQETENVIFEGALAAVASINLDGAPSEELIQQIRLGNQDVLDVKVIPL